MTELFHPRDPGVIENPYPMYHRLQDEDPVHRSDAFSTWILTRYEHVRPMLNDPRFSADRISPYLDQLSPEAREKHATVGPLLQRWAVFMDPPDHTRMRKLMNQAFTSSALAKLRPRVEAIVARMVDRLVDAGARGKDVDFIEEFAFPLPATVIAGMIGVPDSDLDRFHEWSKELAPFVGSALETLDKVGPAERSARALTEYFTGVIEARRADPPAEEDEAIIDLMIRAEEEGDTLDLAELISNCVLLLFAGHETTTNLLANGLMALMQNPDQMALFRGDPERLAGSAVEEFLRYDGPIGAVARSVLEPVELDGKTIPAGDRVFCMLNAANRDPRKFDDPDRLDITREKNQHVIFGYGIHFCIGAPLARMEGQIAFQLLLERLRDIEPGAGEPKWTDSLVLRGVDTLPIRFKTI